jgi:hypothetical protein
MLDDIQAIESRAKVDAVENQLGHIAVVDTRGFEYHGPIIEEVIGASELLDHLEAWDC